MPIGSRFAIRAAAAPRWLPAASAALVLAAACGGTAPLDQQTGGSAGAGANGGSPSDAGAGGGSADGGTSALPASGMQVLYEGEDNLYAIALDDRFIYWGSNEGLRQAPLDGGPPITLVTIASVRAIVPSGEYVYFAQSSFGNGRIARVPRAGGEPQLIAESPGPHDIALADGHVYWSDPGFSIDTGQVFRATLDGSEVTLLADRLPEPSDIALDAESVYFSSSGQSCGVSSEEGASCIGGGIHRVPRSGGAPEQVVPSDDIVSSFWLHDGELYWFASFPPRLMVAPPLGTEREIVNVLADGAGALTSDGEALYWGSEDSVLRLPFDSSAVTRLATNLQSPSSVAVRGGWAHVAEGGSGRILRVATDGSANRPSGPITGPCPEPIGSLEELALTPRADPNLEQLALSLEPGTVTASQATYDRVVADVAAIRALEPDRADIGYRAAHDGKTLYLGLTDVAAQSLLAGEYSAWDCLNERYGASVGEPNESLFGGWSLLLTLRGIYDLSRIAERYAALPGVTGAGPNSAVGDGPTLCAARDGGRYEYVVDRAGGDCPAGCTEHDARAFASEAAGQITAVGAWTSASGEAAPAWFAICR
jgi:hypothetical protein